MIIQSRQNPLYKSVLRLIRGKRPLDGDLPGELIVLEGIHLAQEWLRHQGQPLRALLDAQRLQTCPELQRLAARLDPAATVLMDSSLMRGMSPTAAGQGTVLIASRPHTPMPLRVTAACLLLDRIQDPGNMGTLLRTAAAAGVRHVFASPGCAAVWSPAVLRAGQGAHFALAVHQDVDLHGLVARLDVPLYAAALTPAAIALYDAKLAGVSAWAFGNEGQGIDPGLLAHADQVIRIPHEPAVESLNVAIAAGICLFEQRRRQYRT